MNHSGTQTLTSDRLLLRRFNNDDADAMYENWASDPEVTRYLFWPAHENKEITKLVLEDWTQAYESPSHYQWAITVKEYGPDPIGTISAVRQQEEIEMFHIGYCIGKKWWNQGITAEALKMVINYFFATVGANRVEARFDPRNANSGKVMKKCNMTFEGTFRQADINNQGICDASYYAILKDEYKSKS